MREQHSNDKHSSTLYNFIIMDFTSSFPFIVVIIYEIFKSLCHENFICRIEFWNYTIPLDNIVTVL